MDNQNNQLLSTLEKYLPHAYDLVPTIQVQKFMIFMFEQLFYCNVLGTCHKLLTGLVWYRGIV